MNKLQKNSMVILGILLCISAATIVLEMINLSIFDFILPVAGIGLLVYARINNSAFARNTGLVFLLPGCVYVLMRVFPFLYTYSSVLYAFAFLVLFVILYIIYKKTIFAVLAIFLLLFICSFMAYAFSADKYEMYGYSFMAISAVLLILYFMKRAKNGSMTVILAVFAYLCGVVNLLMSAKIIDNKIYSVSVAGVLLITGMTVIVYSMKKTNDKED